MSAHTPLPPPMAAAHALDRARLADLRACISRQIEADLDRVDRCLFLLDALDGDRELEDGDDAEPSLCGVGSHVPTGNLPGHPMTGDGIDLERDEADLELTAAEWSGRGAHRFSVGEAA